MIKKYLMTPGPTQIPPEVLLAGAQPIVHHRTAAYSAIFSRVLENLKHVYQTENDVLCFTSSGTGAMESAVVNLLSPGDEVLIASCGKFGERWRDLAGVYGLVHDYLEFEWGRPVEPEDIEKALRSSANYKAVFVTHSETSTGAVNDMQAIGAIVEDSDAVLVADSISGMGSAELKTDAWQVDVVVAGSQKALMTPPGLAFASVSDKAWAMAERSKLPKYYFDWRKARKALAAADPQTPYTPAVSLIAGLDAALALIREEGLEKLFHRHRVMGRACREAVKAMGLELFSPDDDRSSSVTAVRVPEKIDDKQLRRLTRDKYGVQLAGGQGPISGKIFRVGHCGYYNYSDIVVALSAMELALRELGFQVDPGAGTARAEQIFGEEGI
ncbi:MAG: alanine--glyoxylate aminotransferase family protein [Thermoleophilia bacterium]|nr:alanine--glyoxylate aminotransferase family protein [Thermoleophilia bacterium]